MKTMGTPYTKEEYFNTSPDDIRHQEQVFLTWPGLPSSPTLMYYSDPDIR